MITDFVVYKCYHNFWTCFWNCSLLTETYYSCVSQLCSSLQYIILTNKQTWWCILFWVDFRDGIRDDGADDLSLTTSALTRQHHHRMTGYQLSSPQLVCVVSHFCKQLTANAGTHIHRYTHTHTRLTALCPGLPRSASTRKVKPIWNSQEQETVSDSGISWAICTSASRSRQITMPAPHYSVLLQAGCPSCCPTNSVKALKANTLIDR